jgi:hypothetical protein
MVPATKIKINREAQEKPVQIVAGTNETFSGRAT